MGGQPINLGGRNLWAQFLPQMFMQKIRHNMEMDKIEAEAKIKGAELKEKRQYTEGRDKIKRQGELAEKGFTPATEGTEGSMQMPVAGGSYNAFKPQKVSVEGVELIETKPGQFIRADASSGEMIKQYQASIKDKSWDPIKSKNPMSGGFADYRAYMARAGATPLEEKVALKNITTPVQSENIELSKQRLQLQKDQERVKMQERSIKAEQMIMGAPEDPRVSTAVQQFQQNAGDQPYFYVTKESKSWYGGQKVKGEKVKLPSDREGRQITAKDIMDTLKANPKKFKSPTDVLKAIGAL